MAAQLVDLGAARARSPKYAERDVVIDSEGEFEIVGAPPPFLSQRAAERADADDRARAHWLADLQTWPRRFRDVIEPQLRDPRTDLAEIAAARRGELVSRGWLADSPAAEIAARLQNYREHIASVRHAGSASWRARRRRRLRRQAGRLVEALWLYGVRRVDASLVGEPLAGIREIGATGVRCLGR